MQSLPIKIEFNQLQKDIVQVLSIIYNDNNTTPHCVVSMGSSEIDTAKDNAKDKVARYFLLIEPYLQEVIDAIEEKANIPALIDARAVASCVSATAMYFAKEKTNLVFRILLLILRETTGWTIKIMFVVNDRKLPLAVHFWLITDSQ